jgi:RNA polymerase sigma-70 factor (ECF subfamily)
MIDFDALFRSCANDLRLFLTRRVASPETAADLAQEAFFRLMRSDTAPDAQDARAYLFRTAANLAIDHRRHSRRQQTSTGEDEAIADFPDPQPSAERTTLSREELRVLKRAIDTLPPRGREIFLLHKIDHVSYDDIATRLGIAKNTVIVHMVRALAHCRRAIELYRADTGGPPE